MNIPVAEIASISANIVVGGYLAWKERREWKARKNGLAANPKRCTDHEVALGRLDERVMHIEEDIRDIKQRLG